MNYHITKIKEYIKNNNIYNFLINFIRTYKIIKSKKYITQNNQVFDIFLKNSMFYPLIFAPFTEEDKKNFAFMENITSFLQKKANNCTYICSVIMPTYNREDTITDSINSVLHQTYSNLELIIIDDFSNDNTESIVKNFNDKRIKYIKNSCHLGCAKSRNIGVNLSLGEYIFYLDSDNTWDPRYLEAMLGAYLYLEHADALYCGQYLFKNDSPLPYAVRFASFNISLLENRNYIDMNCFSHKKNIFNEVGGFDTNLNRLIDYDLILRISFNYNIYSIPVLLSNYYQFKAKFSISSTENFSSALSAIHKKINSNYITQKNLTKNVSAIIPNYNSIKDLKECIYSLRNNKCSEIIVVDNNSSKDTIEDLKELEKSGIIKLILNDYNFGFTYSVNQGIIYADKENDIILANNDSVYDINSIYELQKYAYAVHNCGITTPRQILYKKNKSINIHVPFANNNFNCDVNLSYHHKNIDKINIFSNGKSIELNFAPFFCVYIKREIINNIGLLDAEHGRHYRSDRIYCNLLRHIYGKKIIYVPSAKVYHKLQSATDYIKKSESDTYNQLVVNNMWPEEFMNKFSYKKKYWQ